MADNKVQLEVEVATGKATQDIKNLGKQVETSMRRAGAEAEGAGKKTEVMARRGRSSFRRLATNASHAQNPLAGVGAGVSAIDNSLALLGTRGPSQIATVNSAFGALLASGIGPVSAALVLLTGVASVLFAPKKETAFSGLADDIDSTRRSLEKLRAEAAVVRSGVTATDARVNIEGLRRELTKERLGFDGIVDELLQLRTRNPLFAGLMGAGALLRILGAQTDAEAIEDQVEALKDADTLRRNLDAEARQRERELRREQELAGGSAEAAAIRGGMSPAFARREAELRVMEEQLAVRRAAREYSTAEIEDEEHKLATMREALGTDRKIAEAQEDAAARRKHAQEIERANTVAISETARERAQLESVIARTISASEAVHRKIVVMEREVTGGTEVQRREREKQLALLREQRDILEGIERTEAFRKKQQDAFKVAEAAFNEARQPIDAFEKNIATAMSDGISSALRGDDIDAVLEQFALSMQRHVTDALADALVRSLGVEQGIDSVLGLLDLLPNAPVAPGPGSTVASRSGLSNAEFQSQLPGTVVPLKSGPTKSAQSIVLVADFSGESDRVAESMSSGAAKAVVMKSAGSGMYATEIRSRRR